MAESRKAVAGGTTAFAIAEPDFLPEDIAYDAKTRRFFLSSVRLGKTITGDGRPFAKAEWSVLTLRADPKRRTLWAATGWVPHCAICKTADKDKTALLAFDLDTGALKQRVESPAPGLFGDMTRRASSLPRRRRRSPPMRRRCTSPTTCAGLRRLAPADGIALSGIDGLYVYRGGFLAVQNGTAPPRVVRFSGDLKKMQVLEANTPGFGEPTHGVIVGDELRDAWGDHAVTANICVNKTTSRDRQGVIS